MTTTILGANGKLGSILAGYARAEGLDWRTQARSGTADVIWSGSFDDPATEEVLQEGATLINMIGLTAAADGELHKANVLFVQDLLESAARRHVAHVMLASSAATYGAGIDGVPFREDAVLAPIIPYGASKAAMEDTAQKFAARDTGLAVTILRIGNVAGADGLIWDARRHIKAGTAMPLFRFKDQTAPERSYIGPRDFFTAVNELAAPHTEGLRIVNVVHPTPVSLDNLLSAYRTHVLPDLKWSDTPAPNGFPRSVTLDSKKMQASVNLKETGDIADTLGRQLAEYLTL